MLNMCRLNAEDMEKYIEKFQVCFDMRRLT